MPKQRIYYDGKTYKLKYPEKRTATRGDNILVDNTTGEIIEMPGKTKDEFYIYEVLSDGPLCCDKKGRKTQIFDAKRNKIVGNIFHPYDTDKNLTTIIQNIDTDGQEEKEDEEENKED